MTESKRECGAKTRAGHACTKAPMPNGRCRFHGGKTPAPGPTHPNFKHGRYSKTMPSGIQSAYESGLADPSLVSLRDDLAALQAILIDKWSHMDQGTSTGFWSKMKTLSADIRAADATGDSASVSVLVGEMLNVVDTGDRTLGLLDEIAKLHERKASVASKEWKRQVDLQTMVTAEQMLTVMAAIADTISTVCGDKTIKRAQISMEVGRRMRSFREGVNLNN